MANIPVETGTSAASPNLFARFIGIVTSPRDTYQALVARPRWFGMLALTTVILAFFAALPLTTEAGRDAALEMQVSQMEAFGMKVDDAAYERMQRMQRFAPYQQGGAVLVGAPIMALIISGILFAVFTAALGGQASFKQLFSVVVHAGVISTLSGIFTGLINYASGTMRASATSLGRLLPMFEEGTFAARLLGMVDLFVIWWLIVLAMGLGVLYKRRTQPIAVSLLGVYALIALAVAGIMSRFGGGA